MRRLGFDVAADALEHAFEGAEEDVAGEPIKMDRITSLTSAESICFIDRLASMGIPLAEESEPELVATISALK
jgi:hypothetical protein